MSDLSTPIGDIPGVGRPAARALAEQGLTTLGSLTGADWEPLAGLHGVGPAAGRRLQAALTEHGETMAHPPAPQRRTATVTRGNTGKNAADLKTHATAVDPADYVAGLDTRRSREGHVLLELFGQATGAPATMWGPSMIGYGQTHYVYASGREGDTFHVGFSPRKADLALYGLVNLPRSDVLLEKMGTHRRGAGCVWVKKLEDIDLGALTELVTHAWEHDPGTC